MDLVELKNRNGLVARFSSYGARWIGMFVPDKFGAFDDVLLGFSNICDYQEAEEKYYGAIVGRVCGRIGNAGFNLNGRHFKLTANENGRTHLHGGEHAFHDCFWEANRGTDEYGDEFVTFRHFSPDGDEGYPGDLDVSVVYTLTKDDSLRMVCRGTSGSDTIINLTNHAFFNLCGSKTNDNVLNHRLFLNSSYLIECNDELIPTGKLRSVEGTKLDFRGTPYILESLSTDLYDISKQKGFSLSYKIDNDSRRSINLAAILSDETSGRRLEIHTNQPSIQVYNGYYMTGHDIGKGGFPYYSSAGIALETQGYPDAINQAAFPSVILRKDETYLHITEYKWRLN